LSPSAGGHGAIAAFDDLRKAVYEYDVWLEVFIKTGKIIADTVAVKDGRDLVMALAVLRSLMEWCPVRLANAEER